MAEEKETITDPEMERLNKEKEIANTYQARRHRDWNDNYELFRNKVQTNRLTQRQAVTIPLMKETIKTLLSKVDEPSDITFQELGGDLEKELIIQEKWQETRRTQKLDLVEIQDRKTALLYGRPFRKLNYINGKVLINALDTYSVVTDPLMDPLDIESNRFLVHQNIFRSVRAVLANKKYSKEGKASLKKYLSQKEGIIQSDENKKAWEAQRARLEAMGVESKDFADFAAGDLIVNLSEHYTYVWDLKKKEFIRHVFVYADDKIKLLKEPLEDLIGVSFYPFITWAEDIETQDSWSDSPGDIVRTPNKLINIWLSQMTENRTLKNFQMHWYDSTVEGYTPQTFEPGPGRMLPAPGEPGKTIKPVVISGLEDCLLQIDFLTKLVEKGTAATAIEKGVGEKKQITLGEVEMLVGKAMERTTSMTKFYRKADEELAWKWYKILEANVSDNDKETLYKASTKGKMLSREIKGREWKSKLGYKITANSSAEQEAEKTKGVQKMLAIKNQFPDNPIVQRIVQKRMLQLGDFSPEELKEVEEFEKKKLEVPAIAPPIVPVEEEKTLTEGVRRGVEELKELTSRT